MIARRGTRRARSASPDRSPLKRQCRPRGGGVAERLGRDAALHFVFRLGALLFGEHNPRGPATLALVCKAWQHAVDSQPDRWWWDATRAFWRRSAVLPFERDHIIGWVDSQWREFALVRSWRKQLKHMYLSRQWELVWYDLADGHAFVPTREWLLQPNDEDRHNDLFQQGVKSPYVDPDEPLRIDSFHFEDEDKRYRGSRWFSEYPLQPMHHFEAHRGAVSDKRCVCQLLVRRLRALSDANDEAVTDRSMFKLDPDDDESKEYMRCLYWAKSHLEWITRVKAGAEFCLHWTLVDLHAVDKSVRLHKAIADVNEGTLTPTHRHRGVPCEYRTSHYVHFPTASLYHPPGTKDAGVEIKGEAVAWRVVTSMPGCDTHMQQAFYSAFLARRHLGQGLRTDPSIRCRVGYVCSMAGEEHDHTIFPVYKCGFQVGIVTMAMCKWSGHTCDWESKKPYDGRYFDPPKCASKVMHCGRWMGPGVHPHNVTAKRCSHQILFDDTLCPDCARVESAKSPDYCTACLSANRVDRP